MTWTIDTYNIALFTLILLCELASHQIKIAVKRDSIIIQWSYAINVRDLPSVETIYTVFDFYIRRFHAMVPVTNSSKYQRYKNNYLVPFFIILQTTLNLERGGQLKKGPIKRYIWIFLQVLYWNSAKEWHAFF